MEIEDAIEILTDNWTIIENNRYSNEDLYTALYMAIRALEFLDEDKKKYKEYCKRKVGKNE